MHTWEELRTVPDVGLVASALPSLSVTQTQAKAGRRSGDRLLILQGVQGEELWGLHQARFASAHSAPARGAEVWDRLSLGPQTTHRPRQETDGDLADGGTEDQGWEGSGIFVVVEESGCIHQH